MDPIFVAQRSRWSTAVGVGARNVIRLRAGEAKNDEAREVPVVLQLRTLLIEQRAKRQPDCPYVCFRVVRRGRAAKTLGFRKAWYSACIRSGRAQD
jgi:hypothetical protein